MSGEGVTVFVTTHYMDEAEYCDRLGLIYRGELIAPGESGPAEEPGRCAEKVVDVLCERPQDAMGADSKTAGGCIHEVPSFGRGLHVVVAQATDAIQAISGKLSVPPVFVLRAGADHPLPRRRFVSLIEARDRQEARQREFTG